MIARRVEVGGIVQGVGFRPWVWTLATERGLRGWVRNSSSGVEIEVEGEASSLEAFIGALRGGGPPLARIEEVVVRAIEPAGRRGFSILESRTAPGEFVPISPDIATCEACLAEMRDPADRRHRYPVINCTNCGPRFTIVRDIPYDRPNTTMAAFVMCPRCRAEYEDPANRRYHAQPVACPDCGPVLRLEVGGAVVASREEALEAARGRLACDAGNAEAVSRLREGKRREGKPFALMARSVEAIERDAVIDDAARDLLRSRERPVVLLKRRPESTIAGGVAPGRDRLGFMLPYTPLHDLLLAPEPGYPDALVMTSANLSDEPIAYIDDEAKRRLDRIADAFLLHDRPIHMRTDDSVVARFRAGPSFFRRARGYAPAPLRLPFGGPCILATGGELKNAFCLTRDDRAFVSHHIGDLMHEEARRSFEEGVEHFERIFRIRPEALVCDLHPDYAGTRYAVERAQRETLCLYTAQHQHAHIASCMAEHGLDLDARVIGVSLDGTGYGDDGAIWGGEFLVAGYARYERAAHLRYAPLPGGDAATRRPYRTALSWLREAGVDWSDDLPPVREATSEELDVLTGQLRVGINTPPTSSAGRLFDAFASLLGVCHRITYEAQAAAELEALASAAGGDAGGYRFEIAGGEIDPSAAVREAADDVRRGEQAPTMALRFHRGFASVVCEMCSGIRERTGLDTVALSGGVWQNMLLLDDCTATLERDGFRVLTHRQVPANDGGLSLGQAAIGAACWRDGGEAFTSTQAGG